MKREVVFAECSCRMPEHVIKFEYERWKADDTDFTISMSYRQPHPWWRRIWQALKYVWSPTQWDVQWDNWYMHSTDQCDIHFDNMKTIHHMFGVFIADVEAVREARNSSSKGSDL